MSRKYKKTYQTAQNPSESSPSVQNRTKDGGEPGVWEVVSVLLCGPKKYNKRSLTFGVCLRRFFIVLDNLIAAALLYYVFTWIKFYSNGADTSLGVIIDDMSTLCVKNALGILLIIVATWRRLYYSDSLPCLKNFTYRKPYYDCFLLILGSSVFNFIIWLRLLAAHGFDIDSMSQPVVDESWYNDNVFDYLPYWAQEIRIITACVVFTIRHSFLKNIDMKCGRKIFEKKSPKQQTTDAQEDVS